MLHDDCMMCIAIVITHEYNEMWMKTNEYDKLIVASVDKSSSFTTPSQTKGP